MPAVLVTGANRGLGLEFARQYSQHGWTVLAGCRHPPAAADLQRLARGKSVSVFALDVADGASVARAALELAGHPVDLLLNVAGIVGNRQDTTGQIDYDAWDAVFAVNTFGPMRVLEAFLPHLLAGERRLAVSLTSRLGSIQENTSSGCLPYRASKAALNMAMKNASIDLAAKGVTCVVMNPGWVKTDMGGAGATLEVADSVSAMIRTIGALERASNGRFLNYDGTKCPW